LAAEKLRENHGIALGRETVRQWDEMKYQSATAATGDNERRC
jgi:hypothetical protein